MFKSCTCAVFALMMPTLASANDEVLQFQIESELAYLKVGYGIESVEVRAEGIRTKVVIGVDQIVENFSAIMWDTAARASRMSPAPVLLVAVQQHSPFVRGATRLCYLRARNGQVVDGSC